MEAQDILALAGSLLDGAIADRTAVEDLSGEVSACRDQARSARNEAQKSRRTAYQSAGAAHTVVNRAEWPIGKGDIPPFPLPNRADDAGDRACLLTHTGSSVAQWEDYGRALLDFGFRLHATNTEGGGLYAFYRNDRLAVSLSFGDHDQTLRAVVEYAADTAPVPTEEICEGEPNSAEPCFVAIGDGLYERVNCGMGYAFRLSDGTFVVIDGGMGYPEIIEPLAEKLKKLAGGDRVVVSAWFFTHIHADHVGAAYSMAGRFADWLTVKRVIYAYPGYARCLEAMDPNVYDIAKIARGCLDRFAGVEYITARTGQVFRFPGLSLEVIFSLEDCPMPMPLFAINDTSLVFRVKTCGETWMFLGDVCEPTSPYLVAKCGDRLQSDIVQIAHHGIGGALKEVYQCIKARIALWPCAKSCLDSRGRPEALYDSPKWRALTLEKLEPWLEKHYAQCNGTQVFALPLSDGKVLD